jgi:CDP-diacylglycerol---glycerol-3-phosphate 3-phosphatidyltransferase
MRRKLIINMLQGVIKSRSINVKESKITLLHDPSDYYNQILHGIEVAKENIILSALYIGKGPLEEKILREIEGALSDINRPDLKIKVIVDHSRAQRGGHESALPALSHLVSRFPSRMQVK